MSRHRLRGDWRYYFDCEYFGAPWTQVVAMRGHQVQAKDRIANERKLRRKSRKHIAYYYAEATRAAEPR